MTLFAFPRRLAAPVRLAGPVRLVAAAAAIGVAGLLCAACSGQAARPHAESRPGAQQLSASAGTSVHAAPTVVPSTTPAASPSASARRSSAPSSAPGPAPAPSASAVTGPAPTAPCSTAALRVRVGAANGAAGSVYYPLEFTNISGLTCDMYGYPGVSFVSGPAGGELGGPAVRNSTFGPSVVRLAPGTVAHASVQVVVAQNYPTARCKPVTAHWLRVYPPGQFTPRYVALTAQTCTGKIPGGSTLGIYVVRPGANGP
jgi:hypothetical protein